MSRFERYFHFPTENGITNTIRNGGKGSLTAKHNYDHIAISREFKSEGVYKRMKPNITKEFTYASAFAGIGGMTLGLKPLGGEGVIAWEYDPTEKRRQYAQDAHKLLHPEIPVHGDICEANTDELPDFDVFCFTPPCQAFSVAGKRGGFDDTRGTLTFEALRIVNAKKPKILFMENVKGLMNHLSNADIDGVLTQQFIQGVLLWEREGSSVTIKSDIVKKNAESYLRMILQQNLDCPLDKLDTSSKNTLVIPIEIAESCLEHGLTGRLRYLKTQILQTTKKLKDFPIEQIPQYVCNVDGLVMNLEKLSLTDNLTLKDMSTLDEVASTLSEIALSWKNTSEGNSERKRLFTTLTETSLTTTLQTYISALTELCTVVFILKRSNLLEKWLTKESSRSTEIKESTFLISTFGVMLHAINEIGYTVDFNVLNSKYFDVAQNRERVYLIAIRDDLITPEPWKDVKGTTMLPKAKRRYQEEGARSFNFDWPEQTEVRTRLRDFLEAEVDEKYYLSEDKTAALVAQLEEKDLKVGAVASHPFSKKFEFGGFNNDTYSPAMIATDYKAPKCLLEGGLPIKEATTKGDAVAAEGDAVNIQFPNSKTRRGRVGKQMVNTLEARGCNQGVVERVGNVNPSGNGMNGNVYSIDAGLSPTLTTNKGEGVKVLEDSPIMLGHIDLRGHDAIKRVYSPTGQGPTLTTMGGGHREPKIAEEVRPVLTPERLEKRQNGRRFKEDGEESFTLTSIDRHGVAIGVPPKYRIRKLTPTECLKLQSVPQWAIDALSTQFSDSRLYKFAGNGLTTNVITAIGERLIKYL